MMRALDLVPAWLDRWAQTGGIVLLLDFDGTLAPIVDHPQKAEMPQNTRVAVEQLALTPGVELAIISGRGLDDVRGRVGISGIHYAGNHGMQIEGPRLNLAHPAALDARPTLASAAERLTGELASIPGIQLEDKGLTLTIHYRRADDDSVPHVRRSVTETVGALPGLTITEGKKVLEIRPSVDWGKGQAVDLLLRHLEAPEGSPVIYIGDDVTDEGAFRMVAGLPGERGHGVLVAAHPSPATAATSRLDSPGQVATLLAMLSAGPGEGAF